MTDFRIFMKLLLVMMAVSLSAIAITTGLLYIEALKEREHLLSEVVARYRQSVISMIEAEEFHAAKYHAKELDADKDFVIKRLATIAQRAANQGGLRGDIEIVFGVLRNNTIWLLSQREISKDGKKRESIPMGSDLAVPMQLALQKKHGTIREYDYKGERVLAAYTHYERFGIGVVAKSRILDINSRFIKGCTLATLPAIVLVLLGSGYFWRATSHIVKRLRSDNLKFRRMANERDSANKSLAESEQRLQCFFDAAFEGIVITKDGIFVDCNKQFAAMYGYTIDEMIGMPITNLVHPDDFSLVKDHIKSEYLDTYEHRSIHKDGRTMLVEVHGQMAQLQGRKVRITAIHDLCDREKKLAALKELAERKIQSSKMEAIGNFAAGIAHDFNNLLFPIMGYADILSLDADKSDQKAIDAIKEAAQLAAKLVHRIQSFAKTNGGPHDLTAMDLNYCINECCGFLRSTLPTTVEFILEIDDSLAPVRANETSTKQILLNLCKNAAQALPNESGRIEVRVQNYVAKNDSDDVPAGKYVRIEVVDNGVGMPPDVIERAADPYFTTKEKGIGTGVGLSVVRAIVDSYDSHLRISSRPDAGTRISVYIPVIDDDLAAATLAPGAAASPLGAGQHILVVDDEPYMIEVVGGLLKTLNYIPTCFNDSRKALTQFQAAPDRYAVVLSDATMPHLTGIELIQKIKAINPDVKTVLFSGLGSNCKASDSIAADDIDIFLSKPASRDVFAQALKKLLQ